MFRPLYKAIFRWILLNLNVLHPVVFYVVSRGTDTQRYDIVNTVVLLYQTLLRSLHVSVHRTIIR
jgi:hypothetical protein